MSEPSESSPADSKAKCCQNPWLTCLFVSIFGMIAPPLLGLLGTVFGMVQAFDAVSKDGQGDPAALSEGISKSIVATAVGLCVSSLFLILFVISLVKVLSNRKKK